MGVSEHPSGRSHRSPAVVTVVFAGELDASAAQEFEATLAQIVAGSAADRIVVDVRRAGELSLSAVALVARAAEDAELRGEILSVRGARGAQRLVFERADCARLLEGPHLTPA